MRESLGGAGPLSLCRVVESAAIRNTHASFAKILVMAPPEPRRLVALFLNRWDVANIVTLARGILIGSGPGETRAGLLPIGELSEAQLVELAAEGDLPHLADGLTTWGHAFSFALRRALRECIAPDDPRAVERALYQAYFSWALPQLKPSDRQQRVVRDCVRMMIDLANLGMILARVRDRARASAEERAASGPVETLGRGTIPDRLLAEIASADTLEAAFESLMETYFAPGVEKGILSFGQAQSLAVMEGFLEEVVMERGCRLFRRDMLGISVPVGFIWRKYCELANLRLLARGIAYGMPPNAIRQELVIV
jgi:V/A-type H+/Na+-transporting ATPase subunit C